MFRKDRRERKRGGVILYIKESIQATLTIGVVYHSPNIGQDEDVKLQKAIR